MVAVAVPAPVLAAQVDAFPMMVVEEVAVAVTGAAEVVELVSVLISMV